MPDSNAARIHAAETSGRRPLGRRIRVPDGAIVQTFPLGPALGHTASGQLYLQNSGRSGRMSITAAARKVAAALK